MLLGFSLLLPPRTKGLEFALSFHLITNYGEIMKKVCLVASIILSLAQFALADVVRVPTSEAEDINKVMSKKYWEFWNEAEQKKIDADIEANRKADAIVKLEDANETTLVSVEQISHDFIFGAHIFNFNQLGDKTLNTKYRSLYGSLFNSATIPFYWDKFELEQNRPRFATEYWDSEDFWAEVKEPKAQMHWRRPPTDEIVDFCKSQGIRIHAHPLMWGDNYWQIPVWLHKYCARFGEQEKLDTLVEKYPVRSGRNPKIEFSEKFRKMSPQEFAEYMPNFVKEFHRLHAERIERICKRYANDIESWDVVNESSTDFGKGNIIPDAPICKSHYGIMPQDYVRFAFQIAQANLPKTAKLNLNDYNNNYTAAEAKDLMARGCRVDIIGSQMHLFDPKQTTSIADGANLQTPKAVEHTMNQVDIGLPVHMSEITITAPDTTEKGRMMQAIIARNLYRKWFSCKPVMGITWWNVVDDCGAPGEPSMSGIFTRTMNPKPAFFALDNLINNEWKTKLSTKPDANGVLKFRGFKGKYRIWYKDVNGVEKFVKVHVK